MRLGDGTWASWLAMSDEASGAILYTVAFPTRYWTQVEATEIRAHLQHAFGDWGLPQPCASTMADPGARAVRCRLI